MSEEKRMASIFDLVRMCKCFVDSCEGCPLEKRTGSCPPFDFSEENNKAVLKWCDEHPQKTYAQDFFEKFPKAKRHIENSGKEYPAEVCRAIIFGKEEEDIGCFSKYCYDCWNEVMPEEETK